MTIQELQAKVPHENWTFLAPYLPAINTQLATFGINTPLREAHFLAQVFHESGGFRFTVENLNYSANGLFNTFRKYFPTIALAQHFAHQSQSIANKVYADRLGNGNEASGDGFKFRGRGLIQLTGKTNYQAFGLAAGQDFITHPELVGQAPWALLSAAWFWQNNNISKLADADNVVGVTKAINGGLNGLTNRMHYLEDFKLVLGI